MSRTPTHDPAALLDQAGWVRGLARCLVSDPATADDLVQATWLVALEQPPGEGRPLRAWLGAVMRNLARQTRRSARRRALREQEGARPEAQPSAHEVAAGIALQQELARALLALDEPYRGTLYQRFYEGLPPREIARRAGVPVKTVKTRLSRGLALLRERLDRQHGDRSTWMALCVPLASRAPAASLTLGALIMDMKLKIALACVATCAALALLVLWNNGPRSNGPATEPAPRAAAELEGAREEGAALAGESSTQPRALAEPPSREPPASVPVAAPERLRGRVIDTRGAPAPGLDVVLAEHWDAQTGRARAALRVLARSDAQGAFDAEALEGTLHLVVADEDWVSVLEAYLSGAKSLVRPLIVVARKNPLGGLVVDREGRVVEGAELTVVLDEAWRRELGAALDNTLAASWGVRSDAQGRFDLPTAPRLAGKLRVRSPLHHEALVELPELPVPDLVITLTPLEKPHVIVAGIVLDPDERPVTGAHVVLGTRYLQSDAAGRFRFDLTARGTGSNAERNAEGVWQVVDDRTQLRAVKPGYLPAQLTLAPYDELEKGGTLPPITLHVGGPPLSIGGTVLDQDGAPVPAVEVELLTTTPFGGMPSASEAVGTSWMASFEELLRGGLGAAGVRTDEHGRFELGGLLEREYELDFLDTRTLRRSRVSAVRAGTQDLVVRLPAARELKRVAGRIVSPSGDPVPGVDVRPGFQLPGEFAKTADPVRSDEQGRFEFPALCTEGLGFQLTSDHLFIVFWRTVEPGEDVGKLELVVSRRCFVQVDLTDRPGFADHFSPVDEHGAPCRIMQFLNEAIFFPERSEIEAPKSDVVAVEEQTRAIVLWSGEKEVARLPVKVVAGETVVVRP